MIAFCYTQDLIHIVQDKSQKNSILRVYSKLFSTVEQLLQDEVPSGCHCIKWDFIYFVNSFQFFFFCQRVLSSCAKLCQNMCVLFHKYVEILPSFLAIWGAWLGRAQTLSINGFWKKFELAVPIKTSRLWFTCCCCCCCSTCLHDTIAIHVSKLWRCTFRCDHICVRR